MTTVQDLLFRAGLGRRPLDISELSPAGNAAQDVALRAYPFPFRAMLAICDDSRGTDPAVFEATRAAFGYRGLEIGACTSFAEDDPCAVGSARAGALQAAGLLDGLVGLPCGGADEAAAQLAAAGLIPPVFAGGASVAEAAPLTAAGIRFFTDDGLSGRTKFGDALSFRHTGELRRKFAQFDFGQFGFAGAEGATDLRAVFEAIAPTAQRAFLLNLFDAPLFTLLPTTDENTVFKRFSGPQRPSLSTLSLQLRSQFLTQLETLGGAVIIQQRLGDEALIGLGPSRERRRPAGLDALGLHEALALDDLAERAGDRILVAATARVLGWLELRRRAVLTIEKQPDRWRVEVAVPLSLEREGLALTVRSDAPLVDVTVAGTANPLAMARQPDPASPGRDCLYLEWSKRLWPSL